MLPPAQLFYRAGMNAMIFAAKVATEISYQLNLH